MYAYIYVYLFLQYYIKIHHHHCHLIIYTRPYVLLQHQVDFLTHNLENNVITVKSYPPY